MRMTAVFADLAVPTGSSRQSVAMKSTGRPSTRARAGTTGFSDISGTTLPFGRSKCASSTTAAALSAASRMVGTTRSMRVRSLTSPACSGTFRSTRMTARLCARSRSSMERMGGISFFAARAGRWPGRARPSRLLFYSSHLLLHRLGDSVGRDVEFAIEILIGRAGTETRHADENAVGADEGIPALAHGGFDADANLLIAQNLVAIGRRLAPEKLCARH